LADPRLVGLPAVLSIAPGVAEEVDEGVFVVDVVTVELRTSDSVIVAVTVAVTVELGEGVGVVAGSS